MKHVKPESIPNWVMYTKPNSSKTIGVFLYDILYSFIPPFSFTSDIRFLTIKTPIAALDAKVTSISGDVATVSTTLGTLQGTVTSIDGKVATIETDVGTIQANIADLDVGVDLTPVWIAVVLSVVAAIAACFAVITIRQKIAG